MKYSESLLVNTETTLRIHGTTPSFTAKPRSFTRSSGLLDHKYKRMLGDVEFSCWENSVSLLDQPLARGMLAMWSRTGCSECVGWTVCMMCSRQTDDLSHNCARDPEKNRANASVGQKIWREPRISSLFAWRNKRLRPCGLRFSGCSCAGLPILQLWIASMFGQSQTSILWFSLSLGQRSLHFLTEKDPKLVPGAQRYIHHSKREMLFLCWNLGKRTLRCQRTTEA